ncbi:MAG: carbon-nitrogen hydrolase family protein [Candidatus Odinarchaeum yellowstonii]|uniref:Carbon-nitrogen hydrolase family protein n=1 Tax=Odinarchaeota yellowstonii (strain LCB_4) TaxID=1841599 RepID=A0AAF0IBL2_ODILC|nr:MAG: carbon-nitrogen hydrolase family protein [Candidatus Odinarchaeum yellowstonii]
MSFEIAIHQLAPLTGEKEYNISRLLNSVEKFTSTTPILHVFPELFITGYNCQSKFSILAETIPGESTYKISERLGDRVYVLTGMVELDPINNRLFNTAVLINKKGVVAKYRKIYLPNFWVFREKEFFISGDRPHPVVFEKFKIGVQICYDVNFPELSRFQALNGAECIIVLSATPRESMPRFKYILPARAVENQCFLVYVNRPGVEGPIVFGGNSMVLSPTGDVKLSMGETEESERAVIDLREVKAVRLKTPLLKDALEKSFLNTLNIK